MKKFEEPVMNISLFCENEIIVASGGIKLHEDADGAAGAALISAKLVDLYSISYADMGE